MGLWGMRVSRREMEEVGPHLVLRTTALSSANSFRAVTLDSLGFPLVSLTVLSWSP